VSSLRPGLSDKVGGKVSGAAIRWREFVEGGRAVLARFENGDPALVASDGHHYLACWPDEKLLTSTIALLARKARLKTVKLPPHVRLQRRGDLVVALNYGPAAWTPPALGKRILGRGPVGPCDVGIWRASGA
jgi:beta-galactosidase